MFRVEYLIIVDSINTTTIKALKNLIQSDVDFSIAKNKINFKGYSFLFYVNQGKVATEKKPTYFYLKLICEEEEDIENFTTALKSLRKVLSIVNKHQFILWDDISKHYSTKAYLKIYFIENLMRKLLTKFMLVNLGMNWTIDRIPIDVEKSINKNNNDVNFLNNIDFIQLSNFLFSENYPTHKESLIRKLNQAKDLSNIDINEIKSLLPESNWDKYFENLVECEGDYLNKRWKKLYDLRNSVAHTKSFKLQDLNEVERISGEIAAYLEDAIAKLDEVIIPEEEVENVIENVATERNKEIGGFISNFREVDNLITLVHKQLNRNTGELRDGILSFKQKLDDIYSLAVFPKSTYLKLIKIGKIRDTIVHGTNNDLSNIALSKPNEELVEIIEFIRKMVQVDETFHLEKIKDKKMINLYKELKENISKLPEISIKFNKHYISFIRYGNIVDVKIQQKSVKIWINLSKGAIKNPLKIVKDVSNIGHLGNGDYEISLIDNKHINQIIEYVQISYEKDQQNHENK